MNRKKILFLSSWYPTPNNPTHGIFVKRHAEAVALLHDVYVLYVYGADEDSKEEKVVVSSALTEHRMQFDRRKKSSFGKFRLQKSVYGQGLDRLLQAWGKPDIIHLNVIYPAGIFATLLSRKLKIPLVITEHWTGYLPEDGNYHGFAKKFFTRMCIRQSQAVCPVTAHLAHHMRCHGLSGNYHVVPNVVDTDFFTPSFQERSGEIIFMHLSSLDERQKNPCSVIEAFSSLSVLHPNIRLLFAGDGENFQTIRAHYSHPAIEFHFRPMGTELQKLYQRCDALVLNSRFENLPVVLLEAMSCGKPVISSAVGGIAEYVNEFNGILFSPPDVSSLTAAMEKFLLLKNNFDAKRIRDFAVKNFSKYAIANAFDKVYSLIK